MTPLTNRAIFYVIAGTLTAYLAWGENIFLLPIAIAFPFLYGMSPKRSHAFLLSASYYLTGTRGLLEGVATFFSSSPAAGIILWLLGSISFVFVHTVLWSKSPKRKAWGFIIATLLMSIPPFGIIGWISPLSVAGVLLPNTAIFGLIAILVLMYFAVKLDNENRTNLALIPLLLSLNLFFVPITNDAKNWHGVDTSVPFQSGQNNLEAHLQSVIDAEAHIKAAKQENIVFPESTLGDFNASHRVFWQGYARQYNKTIFLGASLKEEGKSYNVIAKISPKGAPTVVYKQRMPVPVSMWNPLSDNSTEATFFKNPVVNEKNKKISYLICYEQLLIWPYIQSYLNGAEIYVGAANDWWAVGTTIPNVQINTMKSWSRLFGTEYVSSMNL